MRRIVVAFMSTVSATVLLFNYHTSLGASSTSAAQAGSDSETSSGTTESGDSTASGDSGSADPGSGSGSSSKTYTGDEADTQWGVVQVQITVEDGKITKSEAVQYPTENHRDQEINSYAVPQLNSEVVDQQSADIDAVSGATVTSDGYVQSLQSALDEAGL